MRKNYLFDACALIAYLNYENGADIVKNLLHQAKYKEISICMNAANLIEVYYNQIRIHDPGEADTIIQDIYDTFPIYVIKTLDPAIIREAAYIKATNKMSFADTILVATASCTGATVVTSDHAELEPVELQGNIPFLWIRPAKTS
jgi:predicted nucleic acid-binding protein